MLYHFSKWILIIFTGLTMSGCNDGVVIVDDWPIDPVFLNDHLHVWANTSVAHPNDTALIVQTYTPLYTGKGRVIIDVLAGGQVLFIESPIIDTGGLRSGHPPLIRVDFNAGIQTTHTWKVRFPGEVHGGYDVYSWVIMDSIYIDGVLWGMQSDEARDYSPRHYLFADIVPGDNIITFNPAP